MKMYFVKKMILMYETHEVRMKCHFFIYGEKKKRNM